MMLYTPATVYLRIKRRIKNEKAGFSVIKYTAVV